MATIQVQCRFCNKTHPRHWLWYAWEPRYKRVVAHAFGKRNADAPGTLLALLKPFDISLFMTDDFSAYAKELPIERHIVGKRFTQRIERTNLTLRSRLKRLVRKTIGFSKSVEIHDKVIGTFIEREL